MTRKTWATVLLFALFAVFAAGVTHLFILRFQVGDVYPPYSSLRTDPLGAKALYDSFSALPDVETQRHYTAIKRLNSGANLTLFYTAVPLGAAWEKTELDDFDKLLKDGMRLVLTFAPVAEPPEKSRSSTKTKKKKDDEEEPVKVIDEHEFSQQWGFALNFLKKPANAVSALHGERIAGETEPTIAWRSLTFFTKLQPDWRVLYQCEGQPVIIEKNVGAGSIVLCADSYFLSNEALRRDRAPSLLASLSGGNPRIVFDELHHGVAENPGVASLARRYGLAPFFTALLALAGLFVWKNAAPLVPPLAERAQTSDVLAGKDSFAGFVNLLRRNIPPGELLAVCWKAWRESFSHQTRVPKEKLARAESIATETPANQATAGFRELQQILAKTK